MGTYPIYTLFYFPLIFPSVSHGPLYQRPWQSPGTPYPFSRLPPMPHTLYKNYPIVVSVCSYPPQTHAVPCLLILPFSDVLSVLSLSLARTPSLCVTSNLLAYNFPGLALTLPYVLVSRMPILIYPVSHICLYYFLKFLPVEQLYCPLFPLSYFLSP